MRPVSPGTGPLTVKPGIFGDRVDGRPMTFVMHRRYIDTPCSSLCPSIIPIFFSVSPRDYTTRPLRGNRRLTIFPISIMSGLHAFARQMDSTESDVDARRLSCAIATSVKGQCGVWGMFRRQTGGFVAASRMEELDLHPDIYQRKVFRVT